MLRLLAILLCTASAAVAQAVFVCQISDETKTPKLHCQHHHNLAIHDRASDRSPRLVFTTSYYIYGCAQDSLTYNEELGEGSISSERLREFLAAVREIPRKKLEPEAPSGGRPEWAGDYLELDGKKHNVTARPDQPERAKLHSLVHAFLDEVRPKETRKTTSRTIEGDFVPARPLTFEELLREPMKYDGKRVRLAGFYHGEFECSNFGPSEKADHKKSVWLNGASTLAKPANVRLPNDTFITVEGTFNAGSQGHMGGWSGEIERYSMVTKTKP